MFWPYFVIVTNIPQGRDCMSVSQTVRTTYHTTFLQGDFSGHRRTMAPCRSFGCEKLNDSLGEDVQVCWMDCWPLHYLQHLMVMIGAH